jgi:hypothetical protein
MRLQHSLLWKDKHFLRLQRSLLRKDKHFMRLQRSLMISQSIDTYDIMAAPTVAQS